MRIENDIKLDFCDVLIRPKRSKTVSRSKVDLTREYNFLNSGKTWKGVPIVASNMVATGTFAMAKALGKHQMMTCLHKFYDSKELIPWFDSALFYRDGGATYPNQCSFYTLGIKEQDLDKLVRILPSAKPDFFCIDVANGYTDFFCDVVKMLRDKVGDSVIMAGNVCTPEMTQELLISGAADIIKIGIGPGSVCTTRVTTGVGYPQLSAVIECADAAHGCGGHICADGGCTNPGDVAKAFAAGADFVMLGGMLAGTDECEGHWTYDETYTYANSSDWADGKPNGVNKTKKSLFFFGMSSKEAQEQYCGGVRDYRASEGKCVEVPYKGPVEGVLQEVCGGLRSACAYVGTDKLKDLSKCTTFVRVNRTHNTVYGQS